MIASCSDLLWWQINSRSMELERKTIIKSEGRETHPETIWGQNPFLSFSSEGSWDICKSWGLKYWTWATTHDTLALVVHTVRQHYWRYLFGLVLVLTRMRRMWSVTTFCIIWRMFYPPNFCSKSGSQAVCVQCSVSAQRDQLWQRVFSCKPNYLEPKLSKFKRSQCSFFPSSFNTSGGWKNYQLKSNKRCIHLILVLFSTSSCNCRSISEYKQHKWIDACK